MKKPDYSKNVYRDLPYYWVETYGSSGSSVINSLISKYLYKSVSVTTPGFRKLRRSQLPVNPYFQQTISQLSEASPMTMVDSYTDGIKAGGIWNFQLNMSAFTADWAKFTDVLEVPVIGPCGNKLLNRVNTAKANTPVTIAEFHKTAAMVAQTATRVYGTIKAIKSLDFQGAARALGIKISIRREKRWNRQKDKFLKVGSKVRSQTYTNKIYDHRRGRYVYKSDSDVISFASQTWLELQYGWKPLLSDIYSQVEALATVQTERSNTLRFVSASVSGTARARISENAGLGETWKLVRNVVIETRCKMSVGYRIKNPYPDPVHTFGMNNPAIVVWELVPFSWVADWFIPFGLYLESFTATSGLEFSQGFMTTTTKRTVNSYIYQDGTYVRGALRRSWSGSTRGEFTEFLLNRTRLDSFPSPSVPEFKDPRSFAHAASAIALLQSIFLRK